MSRDEIALLRKIRQTPDADLPRLVYADWLDDHNRTDHDDAVAQFIRLSCDGRPSRNKNGRLNPVRKEAREWLAANWRRLLPRLCQDWGKAEKLTQEEQEAYDRQRAKIERMYAEARRAIKSCDYSRANLVLSDVSLSADLATMFSLVTVPRCYSNCGGLATEYVIGVPFFLVNWKGEEQCYTPKVRVRFQRGFAAAASWKAPSLGPLIAKRLAFDQPLAVTAGPGNIDDVFQYLNTS